VLQALPTDRTDPPLGSATGSSVKPIKVPTCAASPNVYAAMEFPKLAVVDNTAGKRAVASVLGVIVNPRAGRAASSPAAAQAMIGTFPTIEILLF